MTDDVSLIWGRQTFSIRLSGRALVKACGWAWKEKKNHNIGFWPGAKLLNAAVSVDVASAFTKTCKLLSRQNIDKPKNPSLQIVMRALKVSGGCGAESGAGG